jgi:hypothetical protein
MAYGLHKDVSCISGLGLGGGETGRETCIYGFGRLGLGIHWVGRGHWIG